MENKYRLKRGNYSIFPLFCLLWKHWKLKSDFLILMSCEHYKKERNFEKTLDCSQDETCHATSNRFHGSSEICPEGHELKKLIDATFIQIASILWIQSNTYHCTEITNYLALRRHKLSNNVVAPLLLASFENRPIIQSKITS